MSPKRVGDRLEDRVFSAVFPHLLQGFLADRQDRLGLPAEDEHADVFDAARTLLYRLLFLLYAEGSGLLPARLEKACSAGKTGLYDRLGELCRAQQGGLFITSPDDSDRREHRTARFLLHHKVPDRYLALAIDGLTRGIDYRSLQVRHLGAIHERLLASDRSGRKASGSYYTPGPIVEYIVAHTIGPVLDRKLAALRTSLGSRDEDLPERLFDLQVLDPAMGTGHFLVAAVDFITGRLLAFLRSLGRGRTDSRLLRRQVLTRCIHGIDLDPLAVELARVSLWLHAGMRGAPLTFLDHRLRCGDALLEEAFGPQDVVLGNPPYVRMERLKPVKALLKAKYECHAERADLFVYFYERAVKLLRPGGQTAFIAPSTWTRTKAGEGLRRFLQQHTTLRSYLDFGDLPVFPGVTTYPCILIAERSEPATDHEVATAVVPALPARDLSLVLQERQVLVRQSSLEAAGWCFEDQARIHLRRKLRSAGVPLKHYCGPPLYGVKTGLNSAFVIDTQTKERLVAQDPGSAGVLRPFLEGKDLKAWRHDWRGLWLIYTHRGIAIEDYPAVLAHLRLFRGRLQRRATAGHHAWYELQQPQLAYAPSYARPKIVYPHFSRWPQFCFDATGFFGNDKTYCLLVEDWYLLGLLNSRALWYFARHSCAIKRGGYLELRVGYVEQLPIVQSPVPDREAIADLARRLSSAPVTDRTALEAELNDRVACLYGLTEQERAIVTDTMSDSSQKRSLVHGS